MAIHGQGGNVAVSSTDYGVSQWKFAKKGDNPGVLVTASAGSMARIAGVKDGTLSFELPWSLAVDTLFEVCAAISFTTKVGGSGKSYTVPALVSGAEVVNPANGPVMLSVTADISGAWTSPS